MNISNHNTLLHVLQNKVATVPDHLLLTMVDRDCKEIKSLTYKQLDDASNRVASMLLQKGCGKGDHVMVAYPIGIEFLVGLLGCMKIGVVPCSIYPPNPRKMRSEMTKFKRFVQDAGAKYALATTAFAKIMTAAGLVCDNGGVSWLATDKLSIKKHHLSNTDCIDPEDEATAFIQYTSGSTGHPKGVMVSHRSLLNNCIEIAAIGEAEPSNTGVMWVPQYHDMGLVGGFMTTIYSGVRLIMASPVDFIRNPLLWVDMVEAYNADFTCAPNMGFALLLKRLRQSGRISDWSTVKRAIFGGEPTRIDVVNGLVDDLKMKPENIWNMYGMAECGLCVTAGVAQAGVDGVVSCGPCSTSYVAIRIVKDGVASVDDGEVGTIFVKSTLAASGYHGKADATRLTFQNKIDGEDGFTWLDTGDLGKVVDGKLFVTGRAKDVIIVNGKNYYPNDIEEMVNSSLGETIRPGRTSVVQLNDNDVAVTVELRPDKNASDDLRNSIRAVVAREFGLNVSRVVVLKSGVTPKTTSGKLKRNEIRQNLITKSWRPGDVVASFCFDESKEEAEEIPDNLDSTSFPSSLLEAIGKVEMSVEKLDDIFAELRLDKHPELITRWASVEKTTRSLQRMCESSREGVLNNLPTVVQFAHLLDRNRDWLPDNAGEILSNTVHSMFVLNFATRELCGDLELCRQKVQSDKAYEDWLCRDMVRNEVPEDAKFLLDDGKVDDPLFGRLHTFAWSKSKSISKFAEFYLEWVQEGRHLFKDPIEKTRKVNLLELNLLEAVWLDKKVARTENGSVGSWLLERASDPAPSSKAELLWGHEHSKWSHVYKAWNLCFVLGLNGDSPLLLGKLLTPTLLHASNERFMAARSVSLYCVDQLSKQKALCGYDTGKHPLLVPLRVSKMFGLLNERWVSSLEIEEYTGIAAGVEDDWMGCIDRWHQSNVALQIKEIVGGKTADGSLLDHGCGMDHRADAVGIVETTLYALFGPNMDMLASWESNGLTSLLHAELMNRVQERHHVTLPINFQLEYKTPDQLKRFIEANTAERFPVSLTDLSSIRIWGDNCGSLSGIPLLILQSISVLTLIAIFALNLLPAYYVGKYTLTFQTVVEVGSSGRYVSWSWLPIVFPTFFITFSLSVIILKWLIIGRYREGVMDMPSWNYFRWWFVDRLVHMWELFVGYYVLNTKLMWLFYRFMGADVSWTCQMNGFLREFDLLSVGPYSMIEHQMPCRKFGIANERPTVEFRAIQVGSYCTVKGVLEGGARLADGSCVDRISAVSAGSQVPPSTMARGSPAYNAGPAQTTASNVGYRLAIDAMKVCWLFLELYLYFALFMLSQVIFNQRLPQEWRYSGLLYWVLLLLSTSFFGLVFTVPMKWILIGQRRADHASTLYREIVYWICDYHFKVSYMLISAVFPHSRLVFTGLLWLLGMDIDMWSFVLDYAYLPPSKADLVKIKNSFVSGRVLFESGGAIEIVNSSIGLGVSIGKGVKINGATVRPQVNVCESLYDGGGDHRPAKFFWKFLVHETVCWCVPVLGFLSLIPAFEVFNALVHDQTSTGLAICGLAASVAVQLITLTCAMWLVERFVQFRGRKMWFPVYINLIGIIPTYGMWFLLWGSPFYGYLLRFMGARVEGELWYFGYGCYDFSLLTFEDGTIVDSSLIIGHYAVYDRVVIAPTRVSGIFQPNSYVHAGAVAIKGSPAFHVSLSTTVDEAVSVSKSTDDEEDCIC